MSDTVRALGVDRGSNAAFLRAWSSQNDKRLRRQRDLGGNSPSGPQSRTTGALIRVEILPPRGGRSCRPDEGDEVLFSLASSFHPATARNGLGLSLGIRQHLETAIIALDPGFMVDSSVYALLHPLETFGRGRFLVTGALRKMVSFVEDSHDRLEVSFPRIQGILDAPKAAFRVLGKKLKSQRPVSTIVVRLSDIEGGAPEVALKGKTSPRLLPFSTKLRSVATSDRPLMLEGPSVLPLSASASPPAVNTASPKGSAKPEPLFISLPFPKVKRAVGGSSQSVAIPEDSPATIALPWVRPAARIPAPKRKALRSRILKFKPNS